MKNTTLPSEKERKQLACLFHQAFIELRYLNSDRSEDLAYALHNIPLEMYGIGAWDIDSIKLRLKHYQAKYAGEGGVDFLAEFTRIFPDERVARRNESPDK